MLGLCDMEAALPRNPRSENSEVTWGICGELRVVLFIVSFSVPLQHYRTVELINTGQARERHSS